MKEQNELEQLFSSAFDGFEVTPPSHVKAAIDESLFATKIPVHKKRGFIWLFPLIGFFFIVSFITLSFNTRNQSTLIVNSSSQFANQTSQSSAQANNNKKNGLNRLIDSNIQSDVSSVNKGDKNRELSQLRGVKVTQKQKKDNNLTTSNKSIKPIDASKDHGQKNRVIQSTKKANSKKSKALETKYKTQKPSERNRLNQNGVIGKAYDQNSVAVPKTDKTVMDEKSNANATRVDNDNSEAKEKQDEVASTNESQSNSNKSTDSTGSNSSNSGTTNSSGTTNASGNALSKWSVGLYTGTFLGVNSLSTNSNNYFEMISPLGFSSSIEVNYGLNNKWTIATGLGYSTFNERISGVIYDTTFIPNGVTIEYIYLNPALQDSIIDSIVTVNYITEIASSNVAQKINYNVFSLPIYGSFGLFNKGNWNSSILAGVRLNYSKATVTNYYEGTPTALISNPEIKQLGISAALRPEITYSFGKFGVGLYLNTSFDLIPIARWSEFDKKRFDFGGGVLLKYRF